MMVQKFAVPLALIRVAAGANGEIARGLGDDLAQGRVIGQDAKVLALREHKEEVLLSALNAVR